MHDFQVGDLVTIVPFKYGSRRAAVIVARGTNPYYRTRTEHKCVFLDAKDAPRQISPYTSNRGWFIERQGDCYRLEPLFEPTDEQLAAATLIMLTGYVPGVDDDA